MATLAAEPAYPHRLSWVIFLSIVPEGLVQISHHSILIVEDGYRFQLTGNITVPVVPPVANPMPLRIGDFFVLTREDTLLHPED